MPASSSDRFRHAFVVGKFAGVRRGLNIGQNVFRHLGANRQHGIGGLIIALCHARLAPCQFFLGAGGHGFERHAHIIVQAPNGLEFPRHAQALAEFLVGKLIEGALVVKNGLHGRGQNGLVLFDGDAAVQWLPLLFRDNRPHEQGHGKKAYGKTREFHFPLH